MTLSQKCQYAVRAVFELSKHQGEGPIKTGDIADAQAIPVRFLELILRQLRQGGFVESRRGVQGGYLLAAEPDTLTVGDVIRFIDGDPTPVTCANDTPESDCPLFGRCAFTRLWTRARNAVKEIYDGTTFQDLVDEQEDLDQGQVLDFSI